MNETVTFPVEVLSGTIAVTGQPKIESRCSGPRRLLTKKVRKSAVGVTVLAPWSNNRIIRSSAILEAAALESVQSVVNQ